MKLIFQSGKLAKSIDNSVFHHSARFAEKQSNVPKKKKVPAATEVRQFSLIRALIPGQMLYHGKALALSSTPSVVYPPEVSGLPQWT
jgi:uracil DNA glycosylase